MASPYEFTLTCGDGGVIEVGTFVWAAGRGRVTHIGEVDVDWSDAQERAVLVEEPNVTVVFDDGTTEVFPVSHQQPRWMYDDEFRFVAEDLLAADAMGVSF